MEEIRLATPADAPSLAPLFAAYRAFFTGRTNLRESRDFLAERLAKAQSVVALAEQDGAVRGFAQLYPLFSSWYAKRIWFLSDLYVSEPARGKGLAKRIIGHVKPSRMKPARVA
ncbi:MAG: GNAT family N-acetyltransferase [Candidatus Eremiobacteraeota bacterium]|nr:GNAT family N-acetyltransferase [Candidatus Eremiobacteraeota bacterium]